MQTAISSKSDSLQVIYDNYVKGLFVVNRRYQRKLVWTQEEKIKFIDSIYHKFSVPLILLATIEEKDGGKHYEIIDGLQRLNAIFSFIENDFAINYENRWCYFDLETLASTKDLLDRGILKQGTPILPRAICMEMVSGYGMPISYITADRQNIEEIFRRINSYGRQLSKQEIRQAGALSHFSDMVRTLATEIRGDVSNSEKVNLKEMKDISLSNYRLNYGIDIHDVFWVKYNIIPDYNMRISRDEEIIAHLLAYMIVGRDYCPSKKSLDDLYLNDTVTLMGGKQRDISSSLQEKEDYIHNNFLAVFNELRSLFEMFQLDFRKLIYKKDDGSRCFRSFQIVYLALYELLVINSMKIANAELLVDSLKGIGGIFQGISDKHWNAQDRNRSIDQMIGGIQKAFEKKVGEDIATDNWRFQFENIMTKARAEASQFDFKMGFHDLDDGKMNQSLVLKCVEILTAEVNKGPQTKGYVLVGITEGIESLKAFKRKYGISTEYSPYSTTPFYITGLNDEIKTYYGDDVDSFLREIKTIIGKSPIEEQYKSYILTHLKLIRYNEKLILVFELQSDNKPIAYNKDFYERRINDTDKADNGEKVAAILNRFAN